jgi:Mn-containing catalase
MIPVRVDRPSPQHAAAVLEQFGGANGELKACLQYFVQSFGVGDRRVRDLLMDISTEEISHLELVGTAVSQLLAPVHYGTPDGTADPTMRVQGDALRSASSTAAKALVLGGGGPLVTDSAGVPFTGAFINATGDLVADLSSDLASELRAKRVYEMLHREVVDRGAREVFDFLIQREETHASLFREALEMVQDLGVTRQYGDTELSHRYPALSAPCDNERYFRTSRGTEPIRGPLGPQEVRVGLPKLRY